jgi:hypothetical protein
MCTGVDILLLQLRWRGVVWHRYCYLCNISGLQLQEERPARREGLLLLMLCVPKAGVSGDYVLGKNVPGVICLFWKNVLYMHQKTRLWPGVCPSEWILQDTTTLTEGTQGRSRPLRMAR